MNILITGCNGQLGNEIQSLQGNFPNHRFFNTDIQNVCSSVRNYSQLDITDSAAVNAFVEEHNIEGIVNCAAFTAVDKAEEEETFCRLLNAEAPAILAKAMGERNGWIIHVSTDYVFDGTSHMPYTEDVATSPQSVYGKTKLDGERAVLELCKEAVVIRTA